jgi:integrase
VRLPKTALEVINAQPRVAGNPYVFAVGGGNGVFNSFSQRKDELDKTVREKELDKKRRNEPFNEKLLKMEPWVIHDLRRTARSLMSRAGVRPDIAERVLGHAIPGVEGVYDRHHYSEEKANALARLATLIESIVTPHTSNVVALRR